MDVPPVGPLAKFGLWIIDAVKAPGRIRLIAAATKDAADPRPSCLRCGDGKVAFDHYVPNQSGRDMAVGRCGNCDLFWLIDQQNGRLYKPLPDHQPPR